jgi:hypothetical protein
MAALNTFEKSVSPLTSGAGDKADNVNLKAIGEALRSIATDVETTDRAPTEPQRRAVAETAARLKLALSSWKQVRDVDLPPLNASLASAGLPPIVIPPLDQIRLAGPSASREVP